MSKFEVNDKVIVIRNKKEDPRESDFSGTPAYPEIGRIGTLVMAEMEDDYLPNFGWIIKWADYKGVDDGDLVKEWMIEKHNPEWDK